MRFLIASGPTEEPIDPVRYLSNRSTGVMGAYLAAEARRRGHSVRWVQSPAQARTARDLLRLLKTEVPKTDIFIMATAVCDVRPRSVSTTKMKKNRLFSLPLVKNPDLLAELSKKKKKGQIFVGFALESSHEKKNATKKISEKKLEVILCQRVTEKLSPFGEARVSAFLLFKDGSSRALGTCSKKTVASVVVRQAERLFCEEKSRDSKQAFC